MAARKTPPSWSELMQASGAYHRHAARGFAMQPHTAGIEHFLEDTLPHGEPETPCNGEYRLDGQPRRLRETGIGENKSGYKLTTIGHRVE
jgi:hypothetical protein